MKKGGRKKVRATRTRRQGADSHKNKSRKVLPPRGKAALQKTKLSRVREPGRPVVPAKLTIPGSTRLFARERLYTLLDGSFTDHRVVWVSAPGGAGKTSLATSYIAARKRPVLWYQIDPGDGDVASFFYFLGLAARVAAPRHKTPLPVLTPEFLADIPTFARNFFRELYRRLPKHGMVVLDNYQELPEASVVHEVMQVLMSEVPEGRSLLVLSRVEPPTVLARLRLCDHAACLGWDRMQFTPEETAGLCGKRLGRGLDGELLARLQHSTRGWAAGIVLLLEQAHAGSGGVSAPPELTADRGLLFDYFAGEFLARSGPAEQELLVKTALLPRIGVRVAHELTGNDQARAILESLARRNYFTVRRAGAGEDAYEFHPLFREYLLKEGGERYTASYLAELRQRAAHCLETEGSHDAAADLYVAAAAWESLASLVLRHARNLMSQGRHETLRQWIGALPVAMMDANPWLRFWLGACVQVTDLAAARDHYTLALAAFRTAGDPAGIYTVWSATVDTFMYSWSDFSPLTPLIEALQAIRREHPSYPTPEIEARVVGSMVCALLWRDPRYEVIQPWVERAMELLLDPVIGIDQRLIIANNVIMYLVICQGNIPMVTRVLDITRPQAQRAGTAPLPRLLWGTMEAAGLMATNRMNECLRVVAESRELAEASGVHFFDSVLNSLSIWIALFAADYEEVARNIEHMRRGLLLDAYFDMAHCHALEAWLEICTGNVVAGRDTNAVGFQLAKRSGAAYGIPWFGMIEAFCCAESGEYDAALAMLDEVLAWCNVTQNRSYRYNALLTRAYVLLLQGHHADTARSLRDALTVGRQNNYLVHPWIGWRRDVMARLLAYALAHNIETPYVREVIRACAFTPPAGAPGVWPYPVKVFTLGSFRVEIDDKPLVFEGRVQRKPLELLQFIVASGGRDVPVSRAIDELWPGGREGESRDKAFEVALYRLRGLLGSNGAILLQNNRLALNPEIVWTDVEEFESLTGETCPDARVIERVLILYRGPFLAQESEEPWLWPLRERLRSRLLRFIMQKSELLVADSRHAEAVALLERGIDIDPLAEEFYLALMRAHEARGALTEALSVYRRCEKTLGSILGIRPSPETEVLYRGLRAR